MNYKFLNVEKKNYRTPNLKRIELDNEISLALESPPVAPGEPGYTGYNQEHSTKDPFQNSMA